MDGPPIRASELTEEVYDLEPSLWPSVRQWRTEERIDAEIRRLKQILDTHLTSEARVFVTMRNKRKLLFAKKILVGTGSCLKHNMAMILTRNMFGLIEARLPGDPKYDKRESVTFLMEVSRFLGLILPYSEFTIH